MFKATRLTDTTHYYKQAACSFTSIINEPSELRYPCPGQNGPQDLRVFLAHLDPGIRASPRSIQMRKWIRKRMAGMLQLRQTCTKMRKSCPQNVNLGYL